MSLRIMCAALDARVGNPLRKLVLIKLADNANEETGECWPSFSRIAEDCEMSRRSVINHIKTLEAHGFLKIERRPGPKGNSSNRYWLTVKYGKLESLEAEGGAGDSPPSAGDSPGGGAGDSPPSAAPAPGGGAGAAPRTCHSFEPVNEPTTSQHAAPRRCDDFEPPTNDPPPPGPPCPKHPTAVIASSNGRKWGERVDLDIAQAMAESIHAKVGGNPPDLLTWANHVRLMREQDGRTPDDIRSLFAWATRHDFWHANILSPQKLRAKWVTLALQRNRDSRGGPSHGHASRQGGAGRHRTAIADEVHANAEAYIRQLGQS